MAVEIRKLVIKATIVENSGQTQTSNGENKPMNMDQEQFDQLLKACVKEVLKINQRNQTR